MAQRAAHRRVRAEGQELLHRAAVAVDGRDRERGDAVDVHGVEGAARAREHGEHGVLRVARALRVDAVVQRGPAVAVDARRVRARPQQPLDGPGLLRVGDGHDERVGVGAVARLGRAAALDDQIDHPRDGVLRALALLAAELRAAVAHGLDGLAHDGLAALGLARVRVGQRLALEEELDALEAVLALVGRVVGLVHRGHEGHAGLLRGLLHLVVVPQVPVEVLEVAELRRVVRRADGPRDVAGLELRERQAAVGLARERRLGGDGAEAQRARRRRHGLGEAAELEEAERAVAQHDAEHGLRAGLAAPVDARLGLEGLRGVGVLVHGVVEVVVLVGLVAAFAELERARDHVDLLRRHELVVVEVG
mmetsp:Transcript_13849/g.47601  ORF Transcript_13849/g.47601 Transcript_13849/m.47601 type:complete len:364 (+) Transcript_13849:1687-2778(+)